MAKLTQSQIDEALKRGVSKEQINKFVGGDVFKEKTRLEKIGDFVGATPVGKGLANVAYDVLGRTGVLGKESKDLITGVEKGTATPEQYQAYSEIYGSMPTHKEVLGGAGKMALTLGTVGSGGIGRSLIGRTVEGGVLGASFTALDNIQKGEDALKNVGIGAAVGSTIPVVGTALTRGLGRFSSNIAQKIESTLIKPTKVDLEDGFKIANIQKYGITGNLTQKLQKVEQKLSDLTQQLRGKIGRSDAVVDLNDIADKTAKAITQNKAKGFGNLAGIKRAVKGMADEIELYSKNGLVDLTEAQVIKQAAGKKGSWVFGFVEPDAKATEMVYSKFYRIIKEEIEKKAPQGVKEINKQISDLIPISHAIIRRIPVAERNNALSLTDVITGGFAIGNPKAIGLFALNRALKSGGVANLLSQGGELLTGLTPKTGITQRIIGR